MLRLQHVASFATGLALTASVAGAQDSVSSSIKWVEKSYRVAVSGAMTMEDAKREAVNRALKQAVEEGVGIEMSGSEFRQRGGDERTLEDRFVSVVNSQSSGEVVSFQLLDSGIVNDRGMPFYDVRLKAQVRPTAGKTDPQFKANIFLNKAQFLVRANSDSSDEIIITVHPTKDSYITIFGVSDDTVQVMFPNPLDSDNLVKGFTKREFPAPEWRRYLTMKAALPPGKRRATELVYVVATKEKIPFEGEAHASSGNVTTVRSTFQQLLAWLATIPPDQRTFAVEQYEIRAAR